MIENNRFKIKTPHGFKTFAGISKTVHTEHLHISFTNDVTVNCSAEHLFWTYSDRMIKAGDLLPGFELKTENGFYEVSNITTLQESVPLFDIIEVENIDSSFYLKNSIKTHNCQFITFEKSLIDTDVLDFYQTPEVIDELNGFNIYKDELEHEDGLLIVTIDPSGGGDDNSVIQVWEIAPKQVHEIASLADPDTDASGIFEKILWLQEFMKERWDYEPDESLIIFERNGIGEGLAQILTQTEKAIENLEMPIFYDSKGKPGLHTTPTIKNKLALQFKNLVEFDKMRINDDKFLEELYGFIRTKAGSYSGKSGYHDDRIMASFLMVYYLMNIFSDFAMGDFSVDNMMLVKKEDKLANDKKEVHDPALIYREKMKKEKERLIESGRSQSEIDEQAKKAEREMFAKQATMGSSIVVDETSDDDIIDVDKYDILPSQSL